MRAGAEKPRMTGPKSPTIPAALATRHDAARGALQRAAGKTGTPFSTLLSLAAAKSELKSAASSRHSTAAGAFQFTEGAWLETVRRRGAVAGRPDMTAHIRRDAAGRWTVDKADRAAVMEARCDFGFASQMTAELCADNRARLAAALGRPATEEEVPLAYFLGLRGARRLIETAETAPDRSVAEFMPGLRAAPAAAVAPRPADDGW